VIEFAKESYADAIQEMRLLYPAHWAEIEGETLLDMDYDRYWELDRLGIIHLFTARDQGCLVGYQVFLVSPALHHKSSLTAFCDFEYLKPKYRKGWNGVKFLRFGEKCLQDFGVHRIMRESTTRLDFGSVLKFLGYRVKAHLYSKVL
jgi:GNAT superfamily N-acetyltransferase